MQKIVIEKPFNYREGGQVHAIAKGEQELSDACCAHAHSIGVAKAPAKEKAKPPATPAAD